MKKKILFVFGTRPEAIKVAPVIKEFYKFPKIFDVKVCITAQHREMLDQVLNFFEIEPDFDLNLMKPSQSLTELTSRIILALKPIISKISPDYVFVHGDTTTTMAASLSSFYSNVSVCHIEAGLRTHNKLSPFPEEINRQIASRISDFHFAPTNSSKNNLINENISNSSILVTGNTVIDSLFYSVNKLKKINPNKIKILKSKILRNDKIILVTTHRRENYGDGFKRIFEALRDLANQRSDIKIIFPVHLNPAVKTAANKILNNSNNILLLNPLSYPEFIWLMNRAKIIITDSGGIQEEAPSLGKPVLVLRDTTERPEAVEAGTVILVGTDKKKIISETIDLLDDNDRFKKMSELHNPYGDGKASERIVKFMMKQSKNL